MKKVENLTFAELEAKKAQFMTDGYQETATIESVEVGKLSGLPVVLNNNNVVSASFGIIPFERKAKDTGDTIKLFFVGCKFNMKHLISGKSYSDVYVKVTDELKNVYSNPANLTKTAMLESSPNPSNDKRTIVKLVSIDK